MNFWDARVNDLSFKMQFPNLWVLHFSSFTLCQFRRLFCSFKSVGGGGGEEKNV